MTQEQRARTADGATPAVKIEPNSRGRFQWGNGVVSMVFETTPDAPVRLIGLSGRGMAPATVDIPGEPDAQPIVELRSSLDSGADNRLKLAVSAAGRRLRFAGAYRYEPDESGHVGQYRLAIRQVDESTGLVVVSVFDAFDCISAVRCFTVVGCDRPFPLEAVSSLNITLPLAAAGIADDDVRIYWGDSSWDLENDWHAVPLRRTTLKDRNQRVNPGMSSARFARRSTSTWSTGEYQPAGIIEAGAGSVTGHDIGNDSRGGIVHDSSDDGGSREHMLVPDVEWTPGQTATKAPKRESSPFSLMWQIEQNGPWEWEVGEDDPGLRVSAYGPEFDDHQWFTMLGPGNDCFTVTATFAIAAGDWQHAVAEMTMKRRGMRTVKAYELGRFEQAAEHQHVVVYNDYMNTLFGDPTTDKELPLIDGAAHAGADIFCIDAGWYDSNDGGWWDMVGEWESSTNRFGPIRFAGLVHAIQAAGLGVGLWLEPEVIGVKSPMADKLPDSAFFQRHGSRVSDEGRYHLDFRSPAAREHATATVERLIEQFDVKYFKFDYNTTPGAGTDYMAESVGGALLDHCRAVQDWIDELRRRHPDVMIENCGSGAMRADHAMLSRLDIQSTSDQCDPVVYAGIAAAAGLTIPPEQQGNWGYAQPDMDDERAVLTLATGVLGRLYLSGFIGEMDVPRLKLVRAAVKLHREVLGVQLDMVPWWPAGLPQFHGDWLACGLRHDLPMTEAIWPARAAGLKAGDVDDYVTVWRRGGDASFEMDLGSYAGDNGPGEIEVRQVFPPVTPNCAPDAAAWIVEETGVPGRFRFTASDLTQPTARIFSVRRKYRI
ncbi:glycoside hydrolase family 36 protein [Bifidobacterium choloepi]|uniref:Alpha-galactosidase n=1 Tax=Bifidobacterium choloepi TaxID=2614131 RepID=A0A6I5NGY1_9BIFI|nr:glycoside hydrolase family 36 protein [Bifidobacterium choloepi]NEG70504.1 alpha-galactosidase [Bifidobacterium choloepi]